MGGLDWQAVPIVFALLNVRDPLGMIMRLAVIRDELGRVTDGA